MKPPAAPDSKLDALARKRALIRSLIEQHGWASTATPPQDDRASATQVIPSNVIPFPTPGK